MRPDRIYLTGMTHAGKSTVGAILANMLDWDYIDVDVEITRQAGKSVAQLFNEVGEPAFRQLEYDVISNMRAVDTVIATGAGAPVNRDLMQVMRRDGFVVFIDVPVDVLVDRVCNGLGDRPLLAGLSREKVSDKLRVMYQERSATYAEAHLTVSGVSRSAEVAAQIYRTLAL